MNARKLRAHNMPTRALVQDHNARVDAGWSLTVSGMQREVTESCGKYLAAYERSIWEYEQASMARELATDAAIDGQCTRASATRQFLNIFHNAPSLLQYLRRRSPSTLRHRPRWWRNMESRVLR